jgi:hypothetical protein
VPKVHFDNFYAFLIFKSAFNFLPNDYFFLQMGFLSVKSAFCLLKCNPKQTLNPKEKKDEENFDVALFATLELFGHVDFCTSETFLMWHCLPCKKRF